MVKMIKFFDVFVKGFIILFVWLLYEKGDVIVKSDVRCGKDWGLFIF